VWNDYSTLEVTQCFHQTAFVASLKLFGPLNLKFEAPSEYILGNPLCIIRGNAKNTWEHRLSCHKIIFLHYSGVIGRDDTGPVTAANLRSQYCNKILLPYLNQAWKKESTPGNYVHAPLDPPTTQYIYSIESLQINNPKKSVYSGIFDKNNWKSTGPP